jgi:hypothetical protein
MKRKTGMRALSMLLALLLMSVVVVSAVSAQDVTATLPAESGEPALVIGDSMKMYSSRVLHRYPICEHPGSRSRKN